MPGVFFVDLDTGGYLDLNGSSTFSAASTIKFPILVAFFQDVDAGKIRLDEKLTIKQELIGGGSGDMQYKPIGTKFTALETATKMIVISDNTATNMLIARLGGATALNQRFLSWGLTTTEIRNLLPDLAGTNTTTPRDLAQLMALVNQGELMSLRSHDRLLDIMRRTRTVTLLPRGLGEGATIAHKTGDIGSMVGDVGLVDMPNGKRYIAVAMVKRPHNDSRAQELIRQISRAAYQQFNKPTVSQIMPATTFITATPMRGSGEVR
jgi:beta-lactamase class A